MIAKQIDQMLTAMEEVESTNDNAEIDGTAGAAACLRYDIEKLAVDHACYRCPKSVFIVLPKDQPRTPAGLAGKVVTSKFEWAQQLSVCSAFVSFDQIPPSGPFFCSAEKGADAVAGGFAAAADERQGSSGAGWGEVQTPRQRGQGEGE